MIDPLSLAVGGVLLGAGFLAGRVNRRTRTPKQAEPICSCKHGLAHHDRQTGHCHGDEKRSRYNKYGEWTGHEYVACTCRRYVGPELLADVWVPPIATSPEESRD